MGATNRLRLGLQEACLGNSHKISLRDIRKWPLRWTSTTKEQNSGSPGSSNTTCLYSGYTYFIHSVMCIEEPSTKVLCGT